MKAYSQDLRQRVLRAVDAGQSQAEVARTLVVSVATIKRYLKQRRETGHVLPKAIPGRPARKGAVLQARLRAQLESHPDATREEHCQLFQVISVFGRFWQSDRRVLRRLRGLAALDLDFEQVIRARDDRRRQSLRVIVQRLVEQHGRPEPPALDEVITVLYTLIGFECFDTLAGPTRSTEEVVPVVQQLAHAALGLNEGSSARSQHTAT